jgi:hypothetical protein
MSAFEYDVAISFLAADQHLADILVTELSGRVTIFVFHERQGELVGRDGIDAFTEVFAKKARICLVLYRAGWGDTPWTRVEANAIKGRSLDEGHNFLVVASLDGTAPIWLPRSRMWFGFDQYGPKTLAGIVESRVTAEGGDIKDESARDRARRLASLAAETEKRENFLQTAEGVKLAELEIERLYAYLEQEISAMSTDAASLGVVFRRKDKDVVAISSPGRSVSFGWSRSYSNSLEAASIYVREIQGPCNFGHGGVHDNRILRAIHVTFTLDMSNQPAWSEEDDPGRMYSTRQMAERYLKVVVDHATEPYVDNPLRAGWTSYEDGLDEDF